MLTLPDPKIIDLFSEILQKERPSSWEHLKALQIDTPLPRLKKPSQLAPFFSFQSILFTNNPKGPLSYLPPQAMPKWQFEDPNGNSSITTFQNLKRLIEVTWVQDQPHLQFWSHWLLTSTKKKAQYMMWLRTHIRPRHTLQINLLPTFLIKRRHPDECIYLEEIIYWAFTEDIPISIQSAQPWQSSGPMSKGVSTYQERFKIGLNISPLNWLSQSSQQSTEPFLDQLSPRIRSILYNLALEKKFCYKQVTIPSS